MSENSSIAYAVADVFADHDVPGDLVQMLRQHGHAIHTAYQLGRHALGDEAHLLFAADQGWVLLSRNQRDFELLHRAWQLWFAARGVSPLPVHAGILIIPQQLQPPYTVLRQAYAAAAAAIHHRLDLRHRNPLTNTLSVWDPWTGGWLPA